MKKNTLIPPLLMITMGTGWLLTSLGVAPEIDWVWTLGLALVGVGTFALGGVDKATIVIGPFFLAASGMSVMRQTGDLPVNTEVPVLVILAGVLLLLARSPAFPMPTWVIEDGDTTGA